MSKRNITALLLITTLTHIGCLDIRKEVYADGSHFSNDSRATNFKAVASRERIFSEFLLEPTSLARMSSPGGASKD